MSQNICQTLDNHKYIKSIVHRKKSANAGQKIGRFISIKNLKYDQILFFMKDGLLTLF